MAWDRKTNDLLSRNNKINNNSGEMLPTPTSYKTKFALSSEPFTSDEVPVFADLGGILASNDVERIPVALSRCLGLAKTSRMTEDTTENDRKPINLVVPPHRRRAVHQALEKSQSNTRRLLPHAVTVHAADSLCELPHLFQSRYGRARIFLLVKNPSAFFHDNDELSSNSDNDSREKGRRHTRLLASSGTKRLGDSSANLLSERRFLTRSILCNQPNEKTVASKEIGSTMKYFIRSKCTVVGVSSFPKEDGVAVRVLQHHEERGIGWRLMFGSEGVQECMDAYVREDESI